MTAEALLASLMAQAEGRGADLVTMRALVEESSQAGARRALASLGLDDERARRDMDELRELLSAWRDAKRSAGKAIVTWFVGVCLALLLIGLAVRLSAGISAVLLLIFIGGIVSAWTRGLQIDCGCFSSGGALAAGETAQYGWEIARDVGFLVLAVLLLWRPRTRLSLDGVLMGERDEQ